MTDEPTTDLEAAAPKGDVLHPGTGELVSLGAPTDVLAHVLAAARDEEDRMLEIKRAVWREVHLRMDAEALWTLDIPELPWKLSGQSPNRVTYDGDKLHASLLPLVDDGTISLRAFSEAVKSETVRTAKVGGCNKLLKLGGKVARAVLSAQSPVTGERRVSLKPRS